MLHRIAASLFYTSDNLHSETAGHLVLETQIYSHSQHDLTMGKKKTKIKNKNPRIKKNKESRVYKKKTGDKKNCREQPDLF